MNDSRFIKACWGEPHDGVPVWFMRQAGRYQPSYRELRAHFSLLELARSPFLLRDVTLTAVEELGVDAAILFSDIMLPLDGLSIEFDIRENVGPIVFNPLRTGSEIGRLPKFSPEALDYVYTGTRLAVQGLGDTPLIGFSGAPFTLASYLVEGEPSRTYRWTKSLLWNDPNAFSALMEQLSDMIVSYLTEQVKAGASALQLFDSWAGALSQRDYQSLVLPHMRRIFDVLRPLNVPLIYFAVGAQHLLTEMASAGATVLGVDWRMPLNVVRSQVGEQLALMGNLDPERLVAGWPATQQGARDILSAMAGDNGFIFNLGHGVPKETDPQVLKHLVQWIHSWQPEVG